MGINNAEVPELGRHGRYAIGTAVLDMPVPSPTLPGDPATAAALSITVRSLAIRIWYPAIASDATKTTTVTYTHDMHLPGAVIVPLSMSGRALADAMPIANERFPIIIMSHGFGGWNTQFSKLAEHIASHGYVVASIDHGDELCATLPEMMVSFANVLMRRSLDQRAVIAAFQAMARDGDARIPACADLTRMALIGYSMGGYGALATVGAGYCYANAPSTMIPAMARDLIDAGSPDAPPDVPIAALILFAPWGGQPDNRAWTPDALATVATPTLIVAGSADDVVNYDHGVCWLYEQMTGANRHLLTFREARHNIIGDDVDLPPDTPFAACEFLKEPVWRGDRLNGINQHFVTAFLDLHLKQASGAQRWLDVPVADANAAEWPLPFGSTAGGALAGDDQPSYWRGFPRRWAVGVSLAHRSV